MIKRSGIIVFNINQVLLVSTPIKGIDKLSFPKGARNRNESTIETAWRELYEETGLTKEHVKLIPGTEFNEFSPKNKKKILIKYYVGHLTKKLEYFKFNKAEIKSVNWYSISLALESNLFESRKNILKMAYHKYKSNQSFE